MPGRVLEFYNYLCKLQQGDFSSLSAVLVNELTCFPYMAFFTFKVPGKKLVLFNVGVEKVPILDKYGKILIAFEFVHYVRLLEIIKDHVDVIQICKKFLQAYADDPARNDFFHELQEKESRYKKEKESWLFIRGDKEEKHLLDSVVINPNPNIIDNVLPTKFKPVFLTKNETNSMILDEKTSRWMPSDMKLQQEKRVFLSYSKKVNEELLKQYADFSSAAKLVELLEKIPNFKLKLTTQEKEAIGQNGNVLVIGRSGTGKTTCAVLRIFSMEILFKIRVTLYKNKLDGLLKDTRFTSDDLDKTVGLHCVFVTASPVLTTEVHRFYDRLTKHIKEELKRKQLKEKQKKEQEAKIQKDMQEKPANENKEWGIIEQPQILEEVSVAKEMERQIKDLELKESEPTNEEKEILDDEELQKKMLKYTSLNEMKEDDFPGFLTLRNLLIMIDGALWKPFFSRNKDNQIVGGDSSAHWHSENKGVLMIDDYHRKMGGNPNEKQRVQADNNLLFEEEEDNMEFDYDNEEELEYAYQRELFLLESQKKHGVKREFVSDLKKRLSFEVDYEYFETYFWPKVLKKFQHISLTPTAVWTEIYSYIKGSASSHLHPAGYLPEKEYLDLLSERKSMLDLDTKKMIFEIYCMYERWKGESSAYDILDLVNYLLVQIRFGRYHGTPIHYMMVDEVQDLPHAILLLLTQITEQGLFFSGDTAQNIAKGVGFRFCDLSHVFDKNHFPKHSVVKPLVRHLTINFRSHARILDLANSLVSILELCFPKTIDKLQKEKSNLDGPKPLLLQHNDIDLLFLVLLGESDYKKQIKKNEAGGLLGKPQIEFGCNQVILVRDQKSKEKIPKLLQHALCLTIYEAKGLEFDDVILFDFFADSGMDINKWNLLSHLIINEKLIEKEEYLKSLTIHEKVKQNLEDLEQQTEEKPEESEDKLYGAKEINGKIATKTVSINKTFYSLDINQYSIVCNELKQLYTAITRPRNRLIIFDNDLEKRQQITQYWTKLDLVSLIDKNKIDFLLSPQIDDPVLINNKENNDSILGSFVQKTSSEEWKAQGLKMMKHKYYEQAYKCFEKAGDQTLITRAQAFRNADEATKIIAKIEADRVYISEKLYQYSELKKSQRKEEKKKLNQLENSAINELKEAAELFLKIELPRQAAQCYFSAKEYEKACKIYLSLELWTQAGEAYFLLENYKKAAECFEKTQDYIRVMECYEALEDWERLIEIVSKYQALMKPQDRSAYIKRFVPLALEKLVEGVGFNEENAEEEKEQELKEIVEKDEEGSSGESEDEEEEKKDKELEEIKEKSQKTEEIIEKNEENTTEEIKEYSTEIQEKNKEIEDVKEEEIIENPQLSHEVSDKIHEISLDEASKLDNKLDEINLESKNQDTSVMDKLSFSQGQQEISHNEKNISFDEINPSDIRSQLEKNEHLSNIDLNDEFLKQDSASLVESLSQIRRENSQIHSDYSAIEYSSYISMATNQNMAIVKTKADIYAQDQTMQKIIHYISCFSEEFRENLAKLRSKSILYTENASNNKVDNENMLDFMVDLDLIDIDFLNLILDILETFKIYKLCIFICNRYRLSSRIGRYLVSIASKYSPFSQESFQSISSFLNPMQRKALLEKAFFANAAVHSVLENVNPNYLKLKTAQETCNSENSLGIEMFQGLLQLGFWKKVVFIADFQTALALTATFFDYSTYKLIFFLYNEKYRTKINENFDVKKPSFAKIPLIMPENELENDVFIVTLQQINWELGEYFSSCVNKHWKSNSPAVNLVNAGIKLEAFPDFFKYNYYLWSFLLEKNQENSNKIFEERLLLALNSLQKLFKSKTFDSENTELEIFDLFLFFANVLLISSSSSELKSLLFAMSNETFVLFVEVFKRLVKFLVKFEMIPLFEPALKGLFTAFRMSLKKNDCEVLAIYGENKAFIHRSSPILYDLSESQQSLPVDVDGDFFLINFYEALKYLTTKLLGQLKDIFCKKIHQIDIFSRDPFEKDVLYYIEINSVFLSILEKYDFHKEKIIDSLKTAPQLVAGGVKIYLEEEDMNYAYDDNEYEENNNSVANVERSIKKISFKPNKLGVELIDVLLHSYILVESNCFRPFKTFKKEIMREKHLNRIEKNCLEALALDFSESFWDYSRRIITVFEILKIIGKEYILYEWLTSFDEKNNEAKIYLNLIEGYFYKSFYCSEEFIEAIYTYISKIINAKIEHVPLEEKAIKFIDAALVLMVAYKKTNFKTQEESIFILKPLASYISDNYDDFNPITDEQINNLVFEAFYWIKKMLSFIASCEKNIIFNSFRTINYLFMTLVSLIINLRNSIDQDIYNEINETIKIIANLPIVKKIHGFQTFMKSLTKLEEVKNYSEKNASKEFTLFTFTVKNAESDKVQNNLIACDQEWTKFTQIATNKEKKKEILEKSSQKKAITIVSNFNSILFKRFLSLYFNGKENNELIQLFEKSPDLLIEQINFIENQSNDVIKTFFSSVLENSLDFHNINRQSVQIVSLYRTFYASLDNYRVSSNQKVLFDELIASKKRCEEIKEAFDIWKSSNVRTEKTNEMDMKKNTKVLALKLAKKGMISRATQLAQRRAGLRKQKALQKKADLLKLSKILKK